MEAGFNKSRRAGALLLIPRTLNYELPLQHLIRQRREEGGQFHRDRVIDTK